MNPPNVNLWENIWNKPRYYFPVLQIIIRAQNDMYTYEEWVRLE